MTDTDNTETTEQETTVDDNTATEIKATTEDETGTDTGQDGNLAREAAKYRTRLRETETERDALKEQLLGARQTQLEAELGGALRNPADLFALTNTGPGDYLTDDLSIDTDKATAAVKQLLTERPELARPQRTIVPGGSESIASVELPAGSPLESALKKVMRV